MSSSLPLGTSINRNSVFHKNKNKIPSSLSPSSSSASVSRTLTHDVFISFRGIDVRKNLLTHILAEFQRKGITSFVDNEMGSGVSLDSELLSAIKAARITIVIFSRNYASSSWCLNELVEIMKCKDEGSQKVMTIFHQVKPTDVRHQGGEFGKAFQETCAGKSEDDKQRWRKALTDAANLHGVESDERKSEADMIAMITKDVLAELQLTRSRDFDDYVGLPAHMESINSLLCLNTNEVRMIGIWGPSGIGKTTISRVLLNKLAPQFPLSARIGDIKRRYLNRHDEYDAKVELQNELVCELLKDKSIKKSHLGIAKERFHDKKVFVILDDVNELWQLQGTVLSPQWFGGGSRIIITTQDKRVLEKHGIKDEDIYKVDYPTIDEALQIFCMYAFDQKNLHHGFEDLAKEVTEHVGNLPLALEVMGSHFKQMSREVWKKELKYFKKTKLHENISDILKFSYEALRVEEKNLFDDIACFFNGGTIYTTEEIIGDDFHRNLRVLKEKSLIYTYNGMIGMHTLLAKLVREDLLGCTVLVDAQKICNALAYNTDNLAIRGISLNLSEITHEQDIHEEAFERMTNLEYLKIYCGETKNFNRTKLKVPQGLNSLPNKLKLLHWDNFPMKSMPFKFHPNSLVKIEMKHSKLEKLWEGNPALGSLKEIDLWESKNLKELPNLSNATSLKRLYLSHCRSLVEIPSSIGNATELEEIDLRNCQSLVKLPYSIGNLKKIEYLNMEGCSNLEAFPISSNSVSKLSVRDSILKRFHEIICWSHFRKLSMRFYNRKLFPPTLGNIKDSDLSSMDTEEVPPSIQNLSPKELPTDINLESLSKLYLSGCKRLKTFPEISTSIVYLNLSSTAIEEVPSSIQNLSRLTELIIKHGNVEILPTNINLESLSKLDLSGCKRLKTFPEISTSIKTLSLKDTAIEEVPSSIWSWFNLHNLVLNGCKSLKVFQPVPDSIDDCDKPFLPQLHLHLTGCTNLVSLPQLPDSLSLLKADHCTSLKRIQASFHNPGMRLDFANCINLSQEATEIIEISDFEDVLLPGKELPAYFEHQAKGDILTVNLDQRFKMTSKRGPLPLFLRFRICLLMPQYDFFYGNMRDYCRILCIQDDHVIGSGLYNYDPPEVELLTEHLYSFESSITIDIPELDVNHIELEFQFSANPDLEIQQCGVHLKAIGFYNDHKGVEYANIKIERNLHTETKRRRCKVRLSDSRDSQIYDEEYIRQHKRQKK